jgi:hypothetical protein
MKLPKNPGFWIVALIVVIALAQVVPVSRKNPEVTSPLLAPPDVAAVLQRACNDCHSNETVWPWYSHVAPVSWFIAHDVSEGRDHLNLSTWGTLPPERKARKIKEMWKEVSDGDMPLPAYRWMHAEARLTDADKAALRDWLSQQAPIDGKD